MATYISDYLTLCYSQPDVLPGRRISPFHIYANETFEVWYDGDFGLCFEHLTFCGLLGAIFCVVSALYAGCSRTKLRRRKLPLALVLRMLISLCIWLVYVVDSIGGFWLSPGRPYAVLLCLFTQWLTWLVHIRCLYELGRSISHHGRGPLNLCAAWLLTFVGSILNLRTVIRWKSSQELYMRSSLPIKEAYFTDLAVITVYVTFSLQCLYFLSLLVKVPKVSKADVVARVVVFDRLKNWRRYEWKSDADELVKEQLISSEQPTVHAQTVNAEDSVGQEVDIKSCGNLDAKEDNSNIFSWLSFLWVEPLMRRGALGLLRNPEDLLQLPQALRVAKTRDTFRTIRQRSVKKRGTVGTRRHEGATLRMYWLKGGREGKANKEESGDLESESMQDLLNQHDKEELLEDQSGAEGCHGSDEAGGSGIVEEEKAESVAWSLHRAVGWHLYPLGLLQLLTDMLGFAGPLLLHALISFMENKTEPASHGYYYALGLFGATLLGSFLGTHYVFQVSKVGIKVRASLITEIYRKALSVSSTTLSQFSTGQVVNFMSTDTDRVVSLCYAFHQCWSLPFQILVSLALLYQQVGVAFLSGLGFCILLVPVNRWLAIKIGKLSTEVMAHKDQRVKMMSEVLAGIRVIKFYVWEKCFMDRIQGYRRLELKSLKGRKYLDAVCVYIWATTPVFISILTFGTYVAMGHSLTAAKVFTSMALIGNLVSPLNTFPWVINTVMETWVSIRRINKFLLLSELDVTDYYHGDEMDTPTSDGMDMSTSGEKDGTAAPTYGEEGMAVAVRDGHFTWGSGRCGEEGGGREGGDGGQREGEEWHLRDVNLSIKPGQFVGIVGKVGSGKTSLLAAINAEMCKLHGEVNVADVGEGFGQFTQEPWILHGSVKENILLGLPYEPDKYDRVIAATAMDQDFQVLVAGDETEVGENGATLSGGQKARIALARAVYQDKSVYLLDDPLAAVDAHVAGHLYQHCIQGLLRDKTRILSTHHTRFLLEADLVVYLVDGRISMVGRPSDVLPHVHTEELVQGDPPIQAGDVKSLSPSNLKNESSEERENESADNELVKEEEKEVGVVAFSVYLAYWSAVGLCLAAAVFLAFLFMQLSRNVSDWWLSYWISHTSNSSNSSHLSFYLGIYGGIVASNSVFTLFRAFLYAYGGICAATVLHKNLLHSILKAPVAFFDTTPIGRIVNRFSSDMFAIDDNLPFIQNLFLAQFYGLLGTLAVICYSLPWFFILLLPLALFYYHIQHFYRRTSRELKRLSAVTLSPVYAHFSETLTGLSVIRGLRATDRFLEDNLHKLEVNQRANYGSYAVARWLGFRLQMLGVVMIAGVAFITVLEHHFNTVDTGLVGLAISYTLSATNQLGGVVTSFTETEKEMVSVERAVQYIRGTPSERTRGSCKPPRNWPSQGILEFRNVILSYRKTLPSALKMVSFTTRPGEKLGVVGRTGAGKSSLFKVIFRVVELTGGDILIDGVNIADIALDRLRSSLAIIPQDPFLFSGSVRQNLDPCDEHSDDDLWSVLKRCHLKDTVTNIGGLGSKVGERGRVFSAGQCQLVCLARALLTKARLIFIDEATASVDGQTDTEIQQTLRSEFTSSTVVTIAHRIETVLHSDRILVLDQGTVRELGPPQVLLDDHHSLFFSLYKSTT